MECRQDVIEIGAEILERELTEEEIVFTNANELSKYNEKLLNGFISYLNNRHKQMYDVFDCGVTVQILPADKLIKDFLNKLNLK